MGILIGDKLPINLQLEGGDTNKYPLAFVYDQTGTQVPSSPFIPIHIDKGLYLNRDYTVRANDSKLFVVYIVYKDALHTIEDAKYFPRTEEMFDIDVAESELVDEIKDLKAYLISVIDIGKLEGIVTLEEDLIGIVADECAEGIVEDETPLIGIAEEDELEGVLDFENNLNGELGC